MTGSLASVHPDAAVQLLLDRAAVRDVILRYAAAVDRRDFDGLRSCFTPDVEGEFGGEWRSGRDALIEFISGVAYFHTTMHMMGNAFVEISGDRASLQSYAMLTHHGTREDGKEWQFNVSNGRYCEGLVRTGKGWRIRERGAEPAWAPKGTAAAQSPDPAVAWLLDRARIHDVAMQYALGIDLREYDRVRGCFAETFRAQYGERVFADLAALIAFIRGVEAFESTTHFLSRPLIEFDGECAKVETLAYITHREARPGRSPREWMSGASRYRDVWVREAGAWRITERLLGAGDARLSVAPCPPPASSDPIVRSLLDRAEISDLVARSALALDRGDYEGAASCFAGAGDEFVERERQASGRWHRSARMLGNHTVAIDSARAQAETYLYRTDHAEEGAPASPWSDGAMRWLDELVRGPSGWRIARREVADNRVRPAV